MNSLIGTMNGVKNIRDLEGLLSTNLKRDEKIVNSEISVFTKPGENYGSIILRVLVKLEDTHTGEERLLDAVGKIIPESKKTQEVFNTQVTFRNECKFYSSIVPMLDKFVRNKGISTGIDFTASLLGGRLNLNNNEEVDTDAVILMQNLKSMGYRTGSKVQGLDFQTSKVVIDSLAKLHAASLAFKMENPQMFKEELMPYFSDYVPEEDYLQMVKKNLLFTLRNNDLSDEEIGKVSAIMNRYGYKKGISEIWGTMIHYDSWTNNFMIQYQGDKPIHSAIVDFQDFGYGTPFNDLMFFIFTSVQADILEEGLDNLLQHYYETFINNLEDLGTDTADYTKDSFQNEVKLAVKNYEYCHAIWMFVPIMNEQMKDMDELHSTGATNWNDKHVQKVIQITRLCLAREWL